MRSHQIEWLSATMPDRMGWLGIVNAMLSDRMSKSDFDRSIKLMLRCSIERGKVRL